MSASEVRVCINPQPKGRRQVQLDDAYQGSGVVTEVSLEFGSEAPYISVLPCLTAQIQWRNLRTLTLGVQRPQAVPAAFYLTAYNFPILTTLRLINVPLHPASELSTLRSLTLQNAARLPQLRTDFQGFMQPLCTSYRQLQRLTLDHALTDAPNLAEIFSTANPLPLTALSVHDAPGRVSAVLDYVQLAACTELHLATTIRGARPKERTPNPFLHLLSPNWIAWRPPQLMEMNTVSFEVVTGRRVRMVCSYDPMGPLVPAMQSTGALKAVFDVLFDNERSATAEDVVLLQACTLVSVAETIELLRMSAVSTICGVTDRRTEIRGELDRRPGGRLQWFSRTPDRREWRKMSL